MKKSERKLLTLLLEENVAAYDGKNWLKPDADDLKGLWVNYIISFCGGPRYEVWDNDFELIEVCWSVDEMLEVVSDRIGNASC